MEQVTFIRKELYDLVWSEPLAKLAKKYKISDNGLRKICKRMNIPIPARGHWQKIQYGKRVTTTKLPDNHEGKDKWGGRIYESTGEFVFVIDIGSYTRKEVKDGHEPIETKISTIIAMLELEGKRMKIERIESDIRRKKWEEQQRIERELRERQEKEAKAFKKLFLQAIRLHQANIIRNYIQTVEANEIEKGSNTEEFIKWLTWAKQKVSWYDPLVNGPDPLLNDHHKTHLFKDFLKEWQ